MFSNSPCRQVLTESERAVHLFSLKSNNNEGADYEEQDIGIVSEKKLPENAKFSSMNEVWSIADRRPKSEISWLFILTLVELFKIYTTYFRGFLDKGIWSREVVAHLCCDTVFPPYPTSNMYLFHALISENIIWFAYQGDSIMCTEMLLLLPFDSSTSSWSTNHHTYLSR